jgi:ABC-2 type transport system permease protein
MSSLHNVWHLILFMLRRDRLWLSFWIVSLVILTTFFAPMIVSVVGDAAAQAVLRETLSSPAMIALCGLAYGEAYTYGAMYAQFMLVWCILAVATMNIMLVVRHTRKDEEEGRLELIAALPVGRGANLLGVMLVALVSNVLVAVLTGAIIAACGVETMGLRGSMLFGCALGVNGLFFAALTAVCAQLFSTAKGAMGWAFGVLGASYLLRAGGDVSSEAAALISPLGLVERSEIWVNDYLWPELTLLAITVALCVLAFVLSTVRSSGQGMLPARRGRQHASAFLRGELGLAWRLTRGMMIAWAVVAFIFSAAYGAIFNDMDSFVHSNEMFGLMLGVGGDVSDVMDPIISMLVLIMGILVAIPVAQVALKLKSEENRARMEQLLALGVSRVYLLGCYLLLSVLLAVALMLLTALGMWSAAYAVMDNPIAFTVFLKTALNFLPAVLIFAALGVFFVGVVPKASPVVWLYLVYSFLATYLGGMFDMPKWAEKLSIFGLLPRYPADEFEPLLAAAVIGAALVLALIGLVAYRRRDIKG